MRKILFACVCIFSLNSSNAQWNWAKQGNGHIKGGGDHYSLAEDRAGNTYVTGQITGSCVFGKDSLYQGNVYVVKYDNNGNEIWGRSSVNSSAGGNKNFGGCIATDFKGNVYVAGSYVDSIAFGSNLLIGSPFINLFLAKFDANGNVKWAITTHGGDTYTVNSTGYSMVTDKAGNVYVTGAFVDTIYFNKTTYLYNHISTDLFLAKYDSNGNLVWARQATGTGYATYGYGLAIDDSSHILLTGYCYGAHTYGTHSVNGQGTVVVKYDSAGNALWAITPKASATAAVYSCYSVAIDGLNVYTVGGFSDTLFFNKDTLVAHSSKGELYVAKYSSSGKALWGKQSKILDSLSWQAFTIAVDSLKNIYITGGTNAFLKTARIVFGKDTFRYTNGYDVSIFMQGDSLFNVLCGYITASGSDDVNSVAVDRSGKYVYFAGDFFGPSILGNDTLGPPTRVSEYPFIARWQPCSNPEGVNELAANTEKVIVYPNPGKGVYAFAIKNEQLKMKSLVEVYNVLGQQVLFQSFSIQNSTFKIDITAQPAGIYLYRIIAANGELIGEGKLIKE